MYLDDRGPLDDHSGRGEFNLSINEITQGLVRAKFPPANKDVVWVAKICERCELRLEKAEKKLKETHFEISAAEEKVLDRALHICPAPDRKLAAHHVAASSSTDSGSLGGREASSSDVLDGSLEEAWEADAEARIGSTSPCPDNPQSGGGSLAVRLVGRTRALDRGVQERVDRACEGLDESTARLRGMLASVRAGRWRPPPAPAATAAAAANGISAAAAGQRGRKGGGGGGGTGSSPPSSPSPRQKPASAPAGTIGAALRQVTSGLSLGSFESELSTKSRGEAAGEDQVRMLEAKGVARARAEKLVGRGYGLELVGGAGGAASPAGAAKEQQAKVHARVALAMVVLWGPLRTTRKRAIVDVLRVDEELTRAGEAAAAGARGGAAGQLADPMSGRLSQDKTAIEREILRKLEEEEGWTRSGPRNPAAKE